MVSSLVLPSGFKLDRKIAFQEPSPTCLALGLVQATTITAKFDVVRTSRQGVLAKYVRKHVGRDLDAI